MRRGPYPLAAHIGLMASALPAAGVEHTETLQNMLLGIQKYQLHPYAREKMPLGILWQAGSITVGAPDQKPVPRAPVLLLVPSMVNRATIMDLMPKRSLLRWLNGQGINACLLDWGEPVQDDGQQDIESVISKRLVPAIEFLAQQNKRPIHVLGYCMGGTLLAGAAQMAAKHISSLIFLAAPWDFHVGGQHLLTRVRALAPSAVPMIAEKGCLKMDWMQTLFASLNPAAGAQKFANFAKLDQKSEEARIFVAVEDWLNDGVDLPALTAQQPIQEWFLENRPAKGQWYVGGRGINPAGLQIPSFIIASKKDRLVDYETAAALQKQIPRAKLIDAGCGHIGMMAGKNAVEKVWQPIAEWVWKHN